MKGRQLMTEAVKTASVFGDKAEVRVQFAGNTAHTDGQTITLPSVDEYQEFSAEDKAVARGYLDHEAGHIKHTDINVMGRCKTSNERQCLNFLEDARIERKISEEYKGAKDNLATLNDRLGADAIKQINAGNEIGRNGLYAAVFNEHHRQCGIGAEGAERFLEVMPQEIVEQAKGYVARLLECESTSEVHELAIELADVELAEPDEPDESDESDESDEPDETGENTEQVEGQVEGQEGTGMGEQNNETSGEVFLGEAQQDGATTQDEEGESQAEGESSEEASSGKGEGKGKGEGSETPVDFSRDPQKIMESMLTGSKERPLWRRLRNDWDFELTVKSTKASAKKAQKGFHAFNDNLTKRLEALLDGDIDEYERTRSKLKGSIAKVKRDIENHLLALRDLRWEGGSRQGRFDSRRCVHAYQGHEDVFSLRTEDKTLDTAVTLLIDHSGSMGGCKINRARQTSICLAEVLSKVDVPFRIVGFDSSGHPINWPRHAEEWGLNPRQQKFIEEMKDSITDSSPIFHIVYKNFDEGYAKVKPRIGAMGWRTLGSHNCDPESLLKEWAILKRRAESKHVMIVISDGLPETAWAHMAGTHRTLFAATKMAVDTITKEGGVISAIGLMTEAVKSFYENYVVVKDESDLPKVSMRVLETAMGDSHEKKKAG
jgi:cobalamin biosynthesis protein CobT